MARSSSLLALALIVAAGLTIAACQPLPRPFQPEPGEPTSALSAPPSGRVVVVPPIPGAPPSLSEKVAAALRAAEIPATTTPGHRDSYVLTGTLTDERIEGERAVEVVFVWRLKSGAGTEAGVFQQNIIVPRESWAKADSGIIAAIAENAAGQTASYIQPPAPKEAVKPEKPPILLGRIEGAPGDGATALTDAIRVALRRAAVPLAETPGDGIFELRGTVNVTRAAAATDMVALQWSLYDQAGKEIGVISQENTVPSGRLNSPWRELALDMADGASQGILALIDAAQGR
jgi:hypothetical protein